MNCSIRLLSYGRLVRVLSAPSCPASACEDATAPRARSLTRSAATSSPPSKLFKDGGLTRKVPLTSHQQVIHASQGHVGAGTSFRRPAALFLDAAGTFLIPSESVSDVYLRYSRRYGVDAEPATVLQRFRAAYNAPWAGRLRYVAGAEDFWRRIVFDSVATTDERIFQDIYRYYATPQAWTVPAGMQDAMARIRLVGVKTCVVSNFDNRLRPLLAAMHLDQLFDAIIVSSEVQADKPSPIIFHAACSKLGVDPTTDLVLHIGDDRRNDVWGARACGIDAWLMGEDVANFDEIADRIITGHTTLQ